MEITSKQIKNALEWDGSSSIDGDGCDHQFEVLEKADPKKVTEVLRELRNDNWGLALASNQPSSEPAKKSSDIRDPYDRFSWMNEF